jgi:hypothetical protein
MAEDLTKLVRELRELKRSVIGRSDERAFYQRVVFLITVLAFVLGGVGFYFRTNAQLLQAVDMKVREMKSEFLSVSEGRRLEQGVAGNAEVAARIAEALDEIRRAISDLNAEVRVVQNEVRSMAREEDR